MGWSCMKEVSDSLKKINAACVAASGQSNVFKVGEASYFFELSSREYADGHATGSIMKMVDESHCVKAGSFSIAPAGKVKGPKFMKEAAAS